MAAIVNANEIDDRLSETAKNSVLTKNGFAIALRNDQSRYEMTKVGTKLLGYESTFKSYFVPS